MAVALFIKNGKAVLCTITPNSVNVMEAEHCIQTYKSPPTSNELMELNRTMLEELAKNAKVKTSFKKMRKNEIADYIVNHWDNILTYYAMDNHARPVLTTQEASGSAGGGVGGGGGGGGGGDDSDGDGGDDDGSGDEEDFEVINDYDGFDEINFLEVRVRVCFAFKKYLMNHVITIFVNPTWKCKSMAYLIAHEIRVNPTYLRFYMMNDDMIWMNLSFTDNGIKDKTTVKVMMGISGGGKRAKAEAKSSAGGNIVSGLDKDAASKKLEDSIGMVLMRCRNFPNLAPCITTVCNKIFDLMNRIKQETFSMEQALKELNVKQLAKLREVKGYSTRVQERCKMIADVFFNTDIVQMREVATQLEDLNVSMVHAIQQALISEFADEAGTIGWDGFTKMVQEIEHEQVEKEGLKRATHTTAGVAGGLRM